MKRFLGCLWMFAGICWILLTDKEQRRQFEYDNGGGEFERTK